MSKSFFHYSFMKLSLLSFIIFLLINLSNQIIILDIYFMSGMSFINGSFCIDKLSMSFVFIVSLISYSVMKYSIGYMIGTNENKFYWLMMIFISFMMILSISCNLLWLMVSWDGLGLSSFCLVMYFMNWKSFNSAMITFMCNRTGDLFMMVSIVFLYLSGSLFSFQYEVSFINNVCLLIFLSSISKSAQIPFSSWLPLAMAAPTPVSSLVHSSTLVTSGIFLCLRFMDLMTKDVLNMMMIISFLTIILAGLSSLWEFDLKKIIALSTLSHIGFIFMFISVKDFYPALIHLIIHAIFKSSLFMVSGVIIHFFNNQQDIRFIKFNVNKNLLWSIFLVCCMSMMGIPFLSGFYSKEVMMLSMINYSNSFLFSFMFLLSVIMTLMYSCRLIMVMFYSKSLSIMNSSNIDKNMEHSILIGLILSCLGGGMIMWLFFDIEYSMSMSFLNNAMKVVIFSLMFFFSWIWLTMILKVYIFKLMLFKMMMFISSITLVYSKPYLLSSLNIWKIEFINDWFFMYLYSDYMNTIKKIELLSGSHMPFIKTLIGMVILMIGLQIMMTFH
uniref:NADH dehydrogenase subunit 5 n=1 Tax=Anatoecus dentatus TaxID=1451298 RepID=UPI0022FD72B8|nr:NADH dehydrogenase subunit 5 [Anatoecus dentatus]WAN81285.1 NADH dehydrogenase subunit 5 [Anatoecus dentatus]